MSQVTTGTRVEERKEEKGEKSHCRVNHILLPRTVVNVDGHATQCGDFGGEFL